MRRRLALGTVLVSLTFLLPAWAQSGAAPGGQSSEAQSGQSSANQPRTVSPPLQIAATGCLRRGNEGGYYLIDLNGNTWELSSKTVNLAAHVMHSVTITGKPMTLLNAPEAKNPPSEQAKSGGNPAHSLQVLTLTVLSPSCTR